MFKETADHLLYPSPTAFSVGHGDVTTLFEVVGRVVGKALYEGIVIQPQFAHFFLAKLLGNTVHLHHLPSLDPELYKNLIFIKNYSGDIRDLCLTFTVPREDAEILGQSGDDEYCLVPGKSHLLRAFTIDNHVVTDTAQVEIKKKLLIKTNSCIYT